MMPLARIRRDRYAIDEFTTDLPHKTPDSPITVPTATRIQSSGSIPPKIVLDQQRQISRMVEMRVSQNDRIKGARIKRRCRPISFPQHLIALEETAIHENTPAIMLDEILRAGDTSRCAKKTEFHSRRS